MLGLLDPASPLSSWSGGRLSYVSSVPVVSTSSAAIFDNARLDS